MYEIIKDGVRRLSDKVAIAVDPNNRDWQEYEEWLAADENNKPEPYVEPPPPVPESITDRQFAMALAERKLITWDDADNWAAAIIPPQIQAAVDQIPVELDRRRTQNFLKASQTFERNHQATLALATIMGWTSAQLDDLWTFASTL